MTATTAPHLRRMTEADYLAWLPKSIVEYAASKRRANGLTETEARESAEADFKRILPDGMNTKGHSFFVFEDDRGERFGSAWYWLRPVGGEIQAFIYDVLIEAKHRGSGHGRALMKAIEKAAAQDGASRIALHVFGNNEPAIRLYQSLGYLTTNLNMEKRIAE